MGIFPDEAMHERKTAVNTRCNAPLSVGNTATVSPSLTLSLAASTSSKPTTLRSAEADDVINSAARSPDMLSRTPLCAASSLAMYTDVREIHYSAKSADVGRIATNGRDLPQG